MAYKDEYEVARLYTDGAFQRQLEQAFEGDLKLEFHLAPPLFARRDPTTGQLEEDELRALDDEGFRGFWPRCAGLRGTRVRHFRPHGRAARGARADRRIRGARATSWSPGSTLDNHALAVALACLPDKIRGFGHVKAANLAATRAGMGEGTGDLAQAERAPDGGRVNRKRPSGRPLRVEGRGFDRARKGTSPRGVWVKL